MRSIKSINKLNNESRKKKNEIEAYQKQKISGRLNRKEKESWETKRGSPEMKNCVDGDGGEVLISTAPRESSRFRFSTN